MFDLKERIAWTGHTILVLTLLFFAAFTSSADENTSDGLQRCVTVEDASARLACYDGLARRTQSAVTPGLEPGDSAPAGKVADEPAADNDRVAQRRPKQEKGEALGFRATVTRCRQDSNRKYYFYFENGEVWKQSDRKKLKYEDCAFDVSVSKDFFGYKMQQDGVDRRIRITRVK